jgi:hypothetical protein
LHPLQHEEQVEQDQAEEEIATLLNDESSEENNRSLKQHLKLLKRKK